MNLYTEYSDKICLEKQHNLTVSEKKIYDLGFFDCSEKAEEQELKIYNKALADLWKIVIQKYDEYLSLEELDKCIDELRLAERQISTINELKDFVRWLWDNHYLLDETFTINLVDSYLEQKGEEE